MKTFVPFCVVLLITVFGRCANAQVTPNMHFYIPQPGDKNWGTDMNQNWLVQDLLDSGKQAFLGVMLPNGATNPALCTPAQLFFNTAATAGQNLFGCTSLNTWTLMSGGGGGSGANTALSNLVGPTAVNITLSPGSGAVNLGTTLKPWQNLFLYGQGAFGSAYFKLDGTPTGARTITLPDASDTLVGRATTDTLTNKSISTNQLTGILLAAQFPAVTGDVTNSAGSLALTLATVNANVGTFGDSTHVAQVTVNGKGLITAVSNVAVSAGGGGANTALSNLASVAINTALLPVTGIDLGSTAAPFRDVFFYGSGTFSTTYFRFTGTPTSTRVITVPDVSDTLVTLAATQTLTGKSIAATQLTGTLQAAQEPAHTGDMTNSAGSLTTVVGAVNGVTYPASPAVHTVPVVTTASTTATYKALPNCTDTSGNHLNYNTGTDAFSCGTSSSGTVTIASGTVTLGTSAITSATCATVATATGTGIATTDTLLASFNGDPTAVTGYIPATAGMLAIVAYPTTNTANFKVCNNTSSSITPGSITVNWRVVR